MIAYLSGQLASLQPSLAVVECNGVGYAAHISLNTYTTLKDHRHVKLLTHFLVKADAHVLYGFHDAHERALFQQLLGIGGIGGSTALAILGSLRPDELESAIRDEDVARIKAVKGVGPKTAARIVLELKGKLPSPDVGSPAASPVGRLRQEALEALVALGLPKSATEKRLQELMNQTPPPQTVEALIKAALRG